MNTPSDCCLTELDKVWLAAIVDGEGCISIMRMRRNDTKAGWRYQPVISFANTDKRLIEHYTNLVSPWLTRVRENKNRSKDPNAKRCYVVEVSRRSCEAFLKAILPYLIAKKEQAELMLEFLAVQEVEGKKNKNLVPMYNEFYIQSRILNRRGTTPIDVEALRQDILVEETEALTT